MLRNNWPVRCLFPSTPGWHKKLRAKGRQALVLDMETRRLPPAKAVLRAAGIARRLARQRLAPVYFKIDSTLRGNLFREIEAIRKASGKRLAWVAPANPLMGRWTIGGRHFVNGMPIEKTEFARDPLHPVRSGDLLAEGDSRLGKGKCALFSLTDAARGPRWAARLRRKWLDGRVRMVVADAVRDGDLRRLARCIPRDDLICGAASLARYCTPPFKGVPRTRLRSVRGKKVRGLAVIGSLNPLTARQVAGAARRKGIETRRLGPPELRRPATVPRPGTRWLVLALEARKFRLADTPRRASEAGERIARALARHAAPALRAWKPGRLLFSGGLTAAAVCEELGVSELVLERELTPGLVLSEALAGRASYRTVTKPGGFGSADCLERLMK